MIFHLPAPPGFRGLDPYTPLRFYTRNLPHWRQEGATYFVTFNLADALPAAKQQQLKSLRQDWELQFPPPRDEVVWNQYARVHFRQVEKWMDAGYGKCWFRHEPYAAELHRAILHLHEQRYEIGCFVIMANHCHLVIRPFPDFEPENEVGSMKSVSALFIHRRESIQGRMWQEESYDRIIRDEEHLYRVIQYVGANPARAGIPRELWHRWMNPNWQAAGWDFHENP